MKEFVKKLTAGEIAELIGAKLYGDPQHEVTHISDLRSTKDNSLSYATAKNFKIFSGDIRGIVLAGPDRGNFTLNSATTLLEVKNPHHAFIGLCKKYLPTRRIQPGIHPTALIDSYTKIEKGVQVCAFVVIGKNSHIGKNTQIASHVFIGEGVEIGASCSIHSGVRILDNSIIGNNVVIHSNTVIGGDGFGFLNSNYEYTRIPHLGNVVIEDEVEIGSCCCIDRAPIASTIVRRGAKLDNLIQVAHGVEIGQNVAIAAQTGISGSSSIGDRSVVGGQVGIAGHIRIAPDTQIQAKSGISSNIENPGKKWYGYPILGYMEYLRSYSVFKLLPDLLRRIERLEKNETEKDSG